MEMSQNTQMLVEKWSPILDHEDIGKIQDPVKRRHTAIVLENQERAMKEERMALNEAGPGNQTGALPRRRRRYRQVRSSANQPSSSFTSKPNRL